MCISIMSKVSLEDNFEFPDSKIKLHAKAIVAEYREKRCSLITDILSDHNLAFEQLFNYW